MIMQMLELCYKNYEKNASSNKNINLRGRERQKAPANKQIKDKKKNQIKSLEVKNSNGNKNSLKGSNKKIEMTEEKSIHLKINQKEFSNLNHRVK